MVLIKSRQIDDRIENSEANQHEYSQLIFVKEAKIIQ